LIRDFGSKAGYSGAVLKLLPYVVAGAYLLVTGIWIPLSDHLLSLFAQDPAAYHSLQTWKGWFFVGVTAVALFAALRWLSGRAAAVFDKAMYAEKRLELALTRAGGGMWDRDLRTGEVYFSGQVRELVGLGPEDALTFDDWKRRIHPADIERIAASTESAIGSRGEKLHEVRYRVRTTDGHYRWVQSRGNVICNERGEPVRMVGVMLDVTMQIEAEERVRQLTRYDAKTGLASTSKFTRDLREDLTRAKRKGHFVAVAQIEIADFNDLLEELSAKSADRIVQVVGQRVRQLVGPSGLAGRLHHDTFVIGTGPRASAREAQTLISSIATALDEPIAVSRRNIRLGFAVGAALGPNDGEAAHLLIANSGRALVRHRGTAREAVQWFTEGMDIESRIRSQRIRDLKVAVRQNQLECHYQPIVNLAEARTIGFEALARWKRPGEGIVPPDQFITLAEETGCIHAIGEEVLWQACRAAAQIGDSDSFMAVNVSARQLDEPGFPALVERVLKETGLPAYRLELEVTENALVHDFEAAGERLTALHDLGVSIAMDDFGNGYSSLSTLSRLPFNRLKIDRGFVTGYGSNRQITAIVNATLHLCNAMSLDVTAEGIETPRQASLLLSRGVQAAQGFFFSRPVTAERLASMVDRDWSPEIREGIKPLIDERRIA